MVNIFVDKPRRERVPAKKTPPGQDPIYMGPNEGPFKCSNCEYYLDPNECLKKEMVKAQKRSPARVNPNGCCNYFESSGNSEDRTDKSDSLEQPEDDNENDDYS